MWGSTLAFELWAKNQQGQTQRGVRVIFNGKTLQLGFPCAAEAFGGLGYCPWTQWRELLAPLIPTEAP